MHPRGRRALPLLLPLLLALLLAPWLSGVRPVRAEDPKETPEQRRKRLDAAERQAAAEEKAFVEEVNRAIDRGHAWLEAWTKEQQSRSAGTYWFAAASDDPQNLGRLALVILTLVKCGSGKNDAVVKQAVLDMEERYKLQRSTGSLFTYSMAVVLLALDALHNPPPAPPGDPRYAAPTRKRCKYPPEIEAWVREIVDWIVAKQAERVWRYPGALGTGGPDQDLSNTQYALLALQAAGRCGIEAPAATYRKALEYLLAAQEADGPEETRWVENPAYEPGGEDRYGPFLPAGKAKARGWRYYDQPGVSVTGSMTTAGLACLAIVKERLDARGDLSKEESGKIDRALVDGLAWMGKHFAVDKNPGQGGWHYYYLYGLERVGAFTGLRHVGKHDWYREGARYLLDKQVVEAPTKERKEERGYWPEPEHSEHAAFEERVIQTCFALLFLRRATVPPAKPLGPVVTGG